MPLRPRLLVLALLAVCVPASAASASTISVAVDEVRYESEWDVTVSGQADAASTVQVYVGDADQACDAFTGTGANGPRIEVPAGPFSKTVRVRNSSGFDLGTRQAACAFLFRQGYSTVEAEASAPVAGDPPKKTIRVNTNNQLDTAATRGGGLSRWDLGCSGGAVNACDMKGEGTISVGADVRRRLGLPSAVIAKGRIKDNGESSWQLLFTASTPVARRLRKASSLPVVFTLELAAPFARTITFATKMLVRKGPSHSPSGLRPLYLDWDETGKRIHPRPGRG
jgi:hypothetical protein